MRSIKYVLFIVLALVLTACGTTEQEGQTGDNESNSNTEEQAVERETLDLTFEVADYDAENNVLPVSFTTNLPNETDIYRVVLKDEEGTNSFIEYEITIEDENEIAFSLEGIDKAALTEKEYSLVLELNVTERTNSNLFTDESVGGSFADMEEVYQDSEQVNLKDLGVDDAYTITLTSSNTQPISEEYFPVEAEQENE